MEPDILTNISWAGSLLGVAYLVYRLLNPFVLLLVARFNKTDTSAQARLDKIQGNDLADLSDFKTRVYAIENRLDSIQSDFQKQFGVIGERLSVLEERTRK